MFSVRSFTRLFTANPLSATRTRVRFSTVTKVEQDASSTTSIPTPEELAPKIPAPPEYPFKIIRTHTGHLPVYQEVKHKGSWKRTRIRRVAGNITALKDLMAKGLNLPNEDLAINQRTRQLLVRGHRREEVMKFLTDLGV